MTDVDQLDSLNQQTGRPSPSFPSASPTTGLDANPELVESTRNEIRSIVREVAHLAQQEIPSSAFYEGFLPRVISALGAIGGAIWSIAEGGEVQVEYQVNLAEVELADAGEDRTRHVMLLRQVMANRQPLISLPNSGGDEEDEAGNPTPYLLLLAPLPCGDGPAMVIEIFQRPGRGPTTQRGYLRFLMQMSDLAAGYFKNQRLQHYSDREVLWEQLEYFLREVHRGLNPRQTAYTIANEGRRLLDCDRVSVLRMEGRTARVEAVSGVDRIETRSASIKRLARLTRVVLAAGEPLWYDGDTGNLPPQIEDALHAFVDETHAKVVGVVPLIQQPDSTENDEDQPTRRMARPKILGAVVIEQLQGEQTPQGLQARSQIVARHSAAALTNALTHDRVFLMPVWRTLGRLRGLTGKAALPKTVLFLAAIAGLVAAAITVPAKFELEGRGTLQPVVRREVFTRIDGDIVDVPVEHGQTVTAGQTLAQLRGTTDLDVEIAKLVGQKLSTKQRMQELNRSLLSNPDLKPADQDRISGELFTLREQVTGIDAELKIYEEKLKQLTITSPIDGQIVTWQVKQQLTNRSVRTGQALLTVVDPTSEWELEVHMPENRMGHLNRTLAAEAAKPAEQRRPVTVNYMLATHPGETFVGTVKQVSRMANAEGEDEPTVIVRVAVDKTQLPQLRPGSSVNARVDCGNRSIGYVWLHPVWEFIQSKVLFRL